MKILNFIKTIILVTLITSSTLGFASNNEGDDSNIEKKSEEEVKLRPTRITFIYRDDGKNEVSNFTYNDKDQVVRFEQTDAGNLQYIYNISYGEDLRINALTASIPNMSWIDGEMYVEQMTKERTYTYDDENSFVIMHSADTSNCYLVDKDGRMRSKETTETEYYTYDYDQYGNLSKYYKYYKDSDNNVGTSIEEYIYSTRYSPFVNTGLPIWFFVVAMEFSWMKELAGQHLPSSFLAKEIFIENDEETILRAVSGTITATEEQNNYPTIIEVVATQVEMESNYTDTSTMLIDYEEMK